jgi:hypothetical protein
MAAYGGDRIVPVVPASEGLRIAMLTGIAIPRRGVRPAAEQLVHREHGERRRHPELTGTDPPLAREVKYLAPLAQQRPEIGQRPKVLQLVRVDDRAHALDLTFRDVEGHHADQSPLAVEEQRPGLPVDLLAA